jgi:hypothetical protein
VGPARAADHGREIGEIVAVAFPRVDPAEVARDVRALLDRLVRDGLALAGQSPREKSA